MSNYFDVLDSYVANASPANVGRALASFLKLYPESEPTVIRILLAEPEISVTAHKPAFVDAAKWCEALIKRNEQKNVSERVAAFVHEMKSHTQPIPFGVRN